MSASQDRMPVLDGIRAVAVSIVLVAHGGLERLVPGGLGVTIFFFLSGFLITSLMRSENARTGTVSLSAFYTRRVLRIMPPLWITLLVSATLVFSGLYPVDDAFGTGRPISALGMVSQAFLFVNYDYFWGQPNALPITGLWSLAIEEHYYLVFPLFYLLVLRKLPPRGQVAVCLAICAAALGFRLYNAATMTDFSANYVWTHTRMDSILLGACLALANNPAQDRDAWRPAGWQAMAALALMAATLVVRDEWFRQTWRYTLQGGALYVLFGYALSDHGWVARVLTSAPAKLVARYSYTLYLVHILLIGLFLRWLPWWPAVAVAMAVSFLYAMAMHAWVERPLANLRRRLHERASPPTVTGSA
ncbi:hypothetical protein BH10PSE13_BH10PSE13_22760 [soil metagenome]